MPIFNNKTDNCIWRKYRNIMIQHSEEDILRLMPGGIRKGLTDKIIKFKRLTESKRKSKK
jgi:hypothetical protein